MVTSLLASVVLNMVDSIDNSKLSFIAAPASLAESKDTIGTIALTLTKSKNEDIKIKNKIPKKKHLSLFEMIENIFLSNLNINDTCHKNIQYILYFL